MTDTMIIGMISVVGGLIAIISPILRLNTNIAKLTTIVEQLEKLVSEKTDELSKRITTHGLEIDQLRLDVSAHDIRIKNLEDKNK